MMGDEDYFLPERIIGRLENKLQERADPGYKVWFADYIKNVAPVRGVRMQEIRFVVSKWHEDWQIEQMSVPPELQLQVALQLFHSRFIEDQLASIVFLDEVLIPTQAVTYSTLPHFEALFERGHITNFKVSDHFSSKVLQPLIIHHGVHVTHRLADWFDASSVWQARSALGALVAFASDAIYEDLILDGCRKLVRRTEDDAKSVVGSALKALGKRSPQIVEDFFTDDVSLACINAAGLSKACESLARPRPKELRARRRLLMQRGVGVQTEQQAQQQAQQALDESQRARVAGAAASAESPAHHPQAAALAAPGAGEAPQLAQGEWQQHVDVVGGSDIPMEFLQIPMPENSDENDEDYVAHDEEMEETDEESEEQEGSAEEAVE